MNAAYLGLAAGSLGCMLWNLLFTMSLGWAAVDLGCLAINIIVAASIAAEEKWGS